MITSLHEFRADLVLLGEMPTMNNLECLRLNSSPIIAFVHRSHERAGTKSMRFAEFQDHPLVMRERGSKTRTKLEQAARAVGVELRPIIEAEGREAVHELVASGAGIGFVSMAEFSKDPRLVPIAIEPADGLMMDEALICLKERRNAKLISTFFNIARDCIDKE